AGTYTLTVTDSCSSVSNSVTITQPNAVLSCSVIQNKAVSSNGLSNGEATVTPIGGNGDYTYLWDNNENTQTASALSAGLHSVTVTDSKGCTTTCTVNITEPNVLSCSISQDSPVKCFGENTGKATVTALGGNGDYTYLWDNGETTAQAITLIAGVHSVTVTDKLNYTTTCTVTISQPQNTLSAVKNQTDATCGGGNNGSATVTVSGGTAGYTYNWNTTPVQTTATASNLASGNYSVLITDTNGCTISESFTILDGDAIKPIVSPLPEISTINCPAEPVFAQATATDNNGAISSLTYTDSVTQGNCTGSYTKTRTWTAVDTCGNISLPVSQTIIVQDNTAPTWTTLAGSLDRTIECSNATALANAQALLPIASDSCDNDVTNIVKVSGQFVASANCSNAGTYTNTWTVTDDCGNISDTFTQIITIQDTTAPKFSGNLPSDIEVSCDAVPEPAEMIASDDCNGNLPIVFTETKSDIVNGCTSNYTLTRTWKTSDCSGNTTSHTQIIKVKDTTPPTGIAPANVINLASIDLIPVGSPSDIKDAADNCSPTVNITVTDTNSGCDGNVYILTRTYTLTDCAGNKTELVQTFSVNCKVKKVIVANDDNAGPIAGVNHTTTNVLNIFSNDTLDGTKISPSDVILTTVTPNDYLHLNPDGSVDVLPNAPVGTLTLVYQICEAAQTDNCDTATVTITIEAPKMTVTATSICVDDVPYIDYVITPLNFTPVNGVKISWADSSNNIITTSSDLPLRGRILWPGAVVDGNGKGIDWPGWIFENNKWVQGADGFEKLRPTANLIISLNPTETITVNYPPADPYCTARPTFTIVANDDSPAAISVPGTATNIINVFTNDTLNNTAVNSSDVTLTTVTPDPKGVLTLNADGSVTVAANAPVGTYTLTYQICEKADVGNCDTAIVTVIIKDAPAPPTPVVANDDNYNNIGCNTFGVVGNVLSNDVKGAVPATLQLVDFTLITQNNDKTNPNIIIDASGNVTVSSLTPAGTYTYSYRICDKLSSENCDTATITITVVPNGVTEIRSTACTDDSTLINLTTLLPEGSPITGNWVDKNNTNALQGGVLNPFGLALGNYAFEYLIADEKCPRSILLTMEVNDDCKVLACGKVLPRNAFSPNGDTFNETFKIDNIDDTTCYPGNTVEIYNRWGILVFETVNYNNTTNAFDGTSRGRTTIKQSDGLPTGTYFYIINYKSLDGNNNIQENKLDGYLYLSR
ncbi:T9SS type B sorting domain-containing protein, partial [Flavobacterium notoginsengisoli]|uniref:T9SS type B sorting domain-containing protein n=1 Tax=Flavobacterium notoginsengisoli TaxID=1478199 RepID=UPI00363B19EE